MSSPPPSPPTSEQNQEKLKVQVTQYLNPPPNAQIMGSGEHEVAVYLQDQQSSVQTTPSELISELLEKTAELLPQAHFAIYETVLVEPSNPITPVVEIFVNPSFPHYATGGPPFLYLLTDEVARRTELTYVANQALNADNVDELASTLNVNLLPFLPPESSAKPADNGQTNAQAPTKEPSGSQIFAVLGLQFTSTCKKFLNLIPRIRKQHRPNGPIQTLDLFRALVAVNIPNRPPLVNAVAKVIQEKKALPGLLAEDGPLEPAHPNYAGLSKPLADSLLLTKRLPEDEPGQIHTDHLLAALLFLLPEDSRLAQNMATEKLTITLREAFLEEAQRRHPGQGWDQLRRLTESSAENVLPSYTPDSISGQPKDSLGFAGDASALGKLICAKSLNPPLSIGIFGEWGSGKSFLMKMIKDRIAKLTAMPVEAYVKKVAIVDFNAWQYEEGDLWASLVENLFRNLSLPNTDPIHPTDEVIQLRQSLAAQIEGLSGEVKNVKLQASEAEANLKEASEKQANAEIELKAKQADIERDVFKSVLGNQFSKSLSGVLSRVGEELPDDTIESATDALDQLRRTANTATYLKRTLKDPYRIAMIVLIGGLTAGLTALATLLIGREQSVLSVAAGLIASSLPIIHWATGQFQKWSKKVAELDQQLSKAKQEKQNEIKKARDEKAAELKEAHKKVDQANSEVAEKERLLAAAQARLSMTNYSQQLKEFVSERGQSADYLSKLGTLALIRRDLQRLSDLLMKANEDGVDAAGMPEINRIVLFIDDLDRCSPEVVVKVLQSLHLLLSFDLFVVVVAVDPRWVSRALKHVYPKLIHLEGVAEAGNQEERLAGTISPDEYLEKIFQIPLWLPKMRPSSAVALVKDVLGSEVRELSFAPVQPDPPQQNQGGEEGAGDTSKSSEEPAGSFNEGDSVPRPAETEQAFKLVGHGPAASTPAPMPEGVPGEVAPEPIPAGQADFPESGPMETVSHIVPPQEEPPETLSPESLVVTQAEVDFMEELASLLVRSPRALKRFLNTYRLIKASMPLQRHLEFVDPDNGDFRLVLFLLAMGTNYSRCFAHWSARVMSMPDASPDLLTSLAEIDKEGNDLKAREQENIELAEMRSWLQGHKLNPSMDRVVAWLPQVRRFTFGFD